MTGPDRPTDDLAPEQFARTLIAALDERDGRTREHSDRVVTLARALGVECGLSSQELRLLGIASAMHDIGKIGIPDHVLMKPGGFNADEWEVMKTHPIRGERILRAIEEEGMSEVATIVRHHHERYDGSGYPDGLAGGDVPLLARILSIVDSYDAMAMPRPYHRARTHQEVMAILDTEEAQKHDPDLLERFRRSAAHGQ
ncbi:HD-GYP domain-containing protein [Azospira restricta]|uniref:HD-GYP domain-containing protein n=1 Tax=Azospira restricta TaxID=404405 RepID=A0A974SRW3_9RHOO|nr:HD-GYP domain-containing protein [Azospira restricta]QRJ65188.1 HD-GYP domain-containing protein [Azospira restricta]